MSAHAPIITPPAIVALRTISISSFMWISLAIAQAPMQAALMDKAVLNTVLYLLISGASAALKLGQYRYKKIVPSIATV